MNIGPRLEKLNCLGMIALFLGVSFFAPFAGGQRQFKFIILPGVLLAVSFWFKKGVYKTILNKAEIPFWVFLLTLIGGLIGVQDSAVAYRHFRLFIFPIPFLYFFAKTAFKEKYGRLIIRSLCLLAVFVCVFGISEFLTKQNFLYTSLAKNMYFEAFKGNRMISTQVHPTPLGTYLAAILPLSIALILLEKKLFLKFMAMLYAAVIFTGIILSFSRGAFLGFFAAMSMLIVFLIRSRKRLYLLALILLCIIIIGICSLYFPSARYSLQALAAPHAYSAKISRIMSIGPILRDKLFLGLGFGHYRVFFDHYLPRLADYCGYDGKVADCMYITILTETGIIGFSGFLVFISFLFIRIRNRLKMLLKNEDKLLLVSFLAGFIGILCSFLTYDGFYWVAPSYLFWSYAGILSFLSGSSETAVKIARNENQGAAHP